MRTACFLQWPPNVSIVGVGALSSEVQWTSMNRSAVTALAGVQGLVRSHVWRGPYLGGPVQWGPMNCGHGHMGTFPFPLYSPLPCPEQNDRNNWKHYLPTTSLAGSNYRCPWENKICTTTLHEFGMGSFLFEQFTNDNIKKHLYLILRYWWHLE